MIAVAKIGGHQALVSVGEKIEVDRLVDAAVGSTVKFETLLIASPDGTHFELGAPFLKDIFVTAKILEHTRGDKVRVFKMKPRKRYRREIGHKQDLTMIEITSIGTHTEKMEKTEKKPVEKKIIKKEVSKTVKKEENTSEHQKIVTKKTPKKK